jgi:sarcosine oxidase
VTGRDGTVGGPRPSPAGPLFDAVVVGLGALGSAAAWALARSGGRVLGLEQFELGHHRGASHDHVRIIRRSYHTPGYVRLAGLAYRAWAELESEAGERLVVTTGGLDLFPPGSAIPPGPYRASLEACGVPYRWLDAAEVMRRWPAFRLEDGVRGLWQADAGLVPAARGTRLMQRLAAGYGATLRDRSPVTAVRDLGGSVEVTTAGATHRAGRLLLCADAWTGDLLAQLGATLPLVVTQEQFSYFRPADPAAADRLAGFLRARLPGAAGAHAHTATCLYTLTPDRDLVLGPVGGHDRVLVALGAAHGFKSPPARPGPGRPGPGGRHRRRHRPVRPRPPHPHRRTGRGQVPGLSTHGRCGAPLSACRTRCLRGPGGRPSARRPRRPRAAWSPRRPRPARPRWQRSCGSPPSACPVRR